MNNNKYVFKVILVGDTGVGKTSIIRFFSCGDKVMSRQQCNIPTIGIDFVIKNIKESDYNVKLQIWDTSGQERFKCITNSYYRGANTCIFVFSLNDKKTFDNINTWYQECLEHDGIGTKILVGAKHDLTREVTPEEIKVVCQKYNFIYTETSAVTGVGIVELFNLITNKMVNDIKHKYGEEQLEYNQVTKTPKLFPDNKFSLTKITHLKTGCSGISCYGTNNKNPGFSRGVLTSNAKKLKEKKKIATDGTDEDREVTEITKIVNNKADVPHNHN